MEEVRSKKLEVRSKKLEVRNKKYPYPAFVLYCIPWSRNVRKRIFDHKRLMDNQIKLRIRAVWWKYSFAKFWINNNDTKFLHVDTKGSDQIARMCRLIRVVVGRTCQKVRYLTSRLILYQDCCSK